MPEEYPQTPAVVQNQQQQALMQMWGQFDSAAYAAGHPAAAYPTPTTAHFKAEPHTAMSMSFHPFAQLGSFATPLFSRAETATPVKKKANPVPESLKDAAYFERRKRNNESARRSREARRAKEEVTQRTVEQLSQENHLLRLEVQRLQAELERFRYLAQMQLANQQQIVS